MKNVHLGRVEKTFDNHVRHITDCVMSRGRGKSGYFKINYLYANDDCADECGGFGQRHHIRLHGRHRRQK